MGMPLCGRALFGCETGYLFASKSWKPFPDIPGEVWILIGGASRPVYPAPVLEFRKGKFAGGDQSALVQ